MLEKFFQLIKIGKELGLSKKEINRVFLFDDRRNPLFLKILLIIIFSFLGIFIIFIIIRFSEHIYPAGSLYSTVKIKDFKAKNKGIKFKKGGII